MTFTRGLGHVEMQADDILYVLGEGESLNQIEEWVRTPEPDDRNRSAIYSAIISLVIKL